MEDNMSKRDASFAHIQMGEFTLGLTSVGRSLIAAIWLHAAFFAVVVPIGSWPAILPTSVAAEAARPLGTGTQILVDDLLIARKVGVVRRVHPCRKLAEPVMASREPWEQNGDDRRIYTYGTVLRDDSANLLRMWYNRNHAVLYATSSDGLSWTRPRLGLHEVAGSKENNIVFPHFHSPSVVYSAKEPRPEHRYQMLGCGRVSGRGYYAAHSADGIRWKLHPKNPILPSSDTCTLALDPTTGQYLAFHKRYHEYRGHKRRLVYLATSRDMQHWSEPVLVMAPDEQDDAQVQAEGGRFSQFYNMSVFPCAGQFLGLVTHFRYSGPPAERGPLQSGDDGPIDVQLVHSRDGRTWNRCEDRSPVIPTGPHQYDAGCILGVTNGPVIVDDQMWFYYTAITTTHAGYVPKKQITIGRAAWRLDGLVSIDAADEEGFLETVAVRSVSDGLVVNVDATGGELRVAVLDEEGDPLPGYERHECMAITEDSVRQAVRWKGRDRLPMDRPLRLRFHLKQAKLFSFAIKE